MSLPGQPHLPPALALLTHVLTLQLDKALRDFLSQMRSPSPESDPEGQPESSNPKPMTAPPVAKLPAAAVSSGRAVPVNAGQNPSQARAERSHNRSSSQSPSAAVSAGLPPAGEPANTVKPALASNTVPAPAQYIASQTQAEHQSQKPVQDVAAAATATQAPESGAAPSDVLNSRHDAAQQTVAAAEDRSPIKVRRVMTDHQSTQTPRAHASPRRLSRAPPGREPQLPFASWADTSDGLPLGHGSYPSPGQRADAFPSILPFKQAAASEAPCRSCSTEQQYEEPGLSAGLFARQSQGVSHEQLQEHTHADEQHLKQMPSQWLHDGQRQAIGQQQLPQQLQGHGAVPAQVAQQLQGQMSADAHLPIQLSDLGISEAHQPPQTQGNATDVSLPALLPPCICPPST